MTAITDALIGFAYVLGPLIRYLFVGDKTPTDDLATALRRNT